MVSKLGFQLSNKRTSVLTTKTQKKGGMQRTGPSQVTTSQGSPGPPDAADTHGTFVHSLGLQRGSRPTNTCISKPSGIKVLLFSMITFVRFS